MAVGTTLAIIGGQDAKQGQFPFYAYLESYKLADKPVIFLHTQNSMCANLNFGKFESIQHLIFTL